MLQKPKTAHTERPHVGVLAGSQGPRQQPASTARGELLSYPKLWSSQLKPQISQSRDKLIQLGSVLILVSQILSINSCTSLSFGVVYYTAINDCYINRHTQSHILRNVLSPIPPPLTDPSKRPSMRKRSTDLTTSDKNPQRKPSAASVLGIFCQLSTALSFPSAAVCSGRKGTANHPGA